MIKELSRIQSIVRDSRAKIESMACDITVTRDSGPTVSAWAFKGNRVILRHIHGKEYMNYYFDGCKNYDIIANHRGQGYDYASTIFTRGYSLGMSSPMDFCYKICTTWLDDALGDESCQLLDVLDDEPYGRVYKIEAPVHDFRSKTFKAWLAEKYGYLIVRTEDDTTDLRFHQCNDFELIDGFWLPRSADSQFMSYKFDNIRINTITDDEVIWPFATGSMIYDDVESVQYRLEESGEWVGTPIIRTA